MVPRPPGCPHPCSLPCHPGACPPCHQMVRQRCHCKITLLYLDCLTFTSADRGTRAELGSCKNQCPKQLGCGHRCKDVCHAGDCEQTCSHRVKLRCPCKRIKKEVPCCKAGDEQSGVVCDDACRDVMRKANELKEADERAAQEEEQRKQQVELEAFEQRQRGRRKKGRRRGEVEEEKEGWRRGSSLVSGAVCVLILAVAAYYLINLE